MNGESQADAVTVAQQSVRPRHSRARMAASIARITVPVVLLGYMFTLVSLRELGTAIAGVSLSALGAVAVVLLIGNTIASVRWRLTFRACGVVGPIA